MWLSKGSKGLYCFMSCDGLVLVGVWKGRTFVQYPSPKQWQSILGHKAAVSSLPYACLFGFCILPGDWETVKIPLNKWKMAFSLYDMIKISWSAIFFSPFPQIKKKKAKSTRRQISFPWVLSLWSLVSNSGNILKAEPLHPLTREE